MNKRIKLLISVLFMISALLTAALTSFNFNLSQGDSSEKKSSDIKSVTNRSYGNYYIYKNKSGHLGIIDSDKKVVVDAGWDDILFVDDDRFIVGMKINGILNYGMIDTTQNIILPVIYNKINRISDDVFAGYIKNANTVVLVNNDGIPYVQEEWNTFDLSTDGRYILTKDGIQITADITDEAFSVDEMILPVEINDFSTSLTFSSDKYNLTEDYQSIIKFAEKSSECIETLLSERLTTESFLDLGCGYYDITQMDYIDGYTLLNILQPVIKVYHEGDSVNYTFSIKVWLASDDKSQISSQIRAKFTITMTENQTGAFVLKDIESIVL